MALPRSARESMGRLQGTDIMVPMVSQDGVVNITSTDCVTSPRVPKDHLKHWLNAVVSQC